MHQSLARYDTPINVTDIHNLGLELEVDKLNAGEIYRTTYQGPYGHIYAQFLNVVLNVNFNEDGTGSIAEGSYYPTEEVDDCVADIAILPITDELIYTSNLDDNLIVPSTNILGSELDGVHDHPTDGFTDGTPIYGGESSGSVSLIQTDIFDRFPSVPVNPTLCDGAGNCFDVILENGETIIGGSQLPGMAGGYVLKGNLESIAPNENDCADLYIEWHAIDGPISGSGLGDEIGADEDGDGTDFDRIWAMESLMATYLNPSCGYNYPIFGDVGDQLIALGLDSSCIDRYDIATEGYVFNESNSSYGNLVTYNSLTSGGDDSDYDYNGTDGRLIMRFDPMCIQDINVRYMMLEFVQVGGGSCVCPQLGDINGDGGQNVLDIVSLANCVLAQNCVDLENACAGDLNGDGGYNVLDIVSLANCVLAQNCE
tara:strand:+ start:251 stop:1531 length:1281 start_codon:yes stop_codon:yes gene_type:complete